MKYLEDEVKKGKIVIVSSHDLELIEKYCKRLVCIKKGKIFYDGLISEFVKSESLREKTLKELNNE